MQASGSCTPLHCRGYGRLEEVLVVVAVAELVVELVSVVVVVDVWRLIRYDVILAMMDALLRTMAEAESPWPVVMVATTDNHVRAPLVPWCRRGEYATGTVLQSATLWIRSANRKM